MLNFTEVAPHETTYGHKKYVCLAQNISIGSFHASFHNFHIVSIFYISEMTTKASNAHEVGIIGIFV